MSTAIASSVIEHPGVFVLEELEARGWTQRDLAFILGRPEQLVSKIVSGRSGITPATAKELAEAFDVSAEVFLNLQKAYDLARAADPDPGVRRRARLQTPYPVREMIKRGWFEEAEPDLLDVQMARFFEVASVDQIPFMPRAHAAKKTDNSHANPIEIAWVYRVRQVARSIELPRYSAAALTEALPSLRSLLIEPDEIRHVPRILEACGVRFVLVEALPSSKICGATTWLDGSRPVIGMSLRFDRIDNFWFVLRHEIEHVLAGHGKDHPMIDGDSELDVDSQISAEETQANEASLDFAVLRADFERFIVRKAPYISKADILGFAKRQSVHPGIVAGRVQSRLDRWNVFNEFKVKVRHHLLKSALHDGWGQVAPVDL